VLHQHLHLDQLDERAAPRQHAGTFQQRLLLERLQLEILRQRVDQIVVGHVAWQPPAAFVLQRGREDLLEPLPCLA
jgi:hypothetical protein